jgi:hypothetical protein
MKYLTNFSESPKEIKIKFTLDKYTKIVLSVIALCLILTVVNVYFEPGELNASQTVQDVNIKSINGSSLWGNELPVDLKEINSRSINNDNIPVNIQSVKGKDLWDDKLPVDIKSINGSFIYGSEIPVKVK